MSTLSARGQTYFSFSRSTGLDELMMSEYGRESVMLGGALRDIDGAH
jgi:hypothetical protein